MIVKKNTAVIYYYFSQNSIILENFLDLTGNYVKYYKQNFIIIYFVLIIYL